MEAYIVGGWVRDHLLAREGRAPSAGGDRDWVVVGSTPEQMIAQGFQPVGRDFPVFLHPQTHEEYALARTERKTAPGYRGFVVHAAPEVTLEQDLQRRDLTINAMALDARGQLIDPHGGQQDLRARVLRHVGPAFVEDPVRILRLARFAARFPDFTVAPQTLELARAMVDAGEADALVPERVWQELTRGLMEARPARMLQVLADTGVLARTAAALRVTPALLEALDRAARSGAPLPVRVAVLTSAAVSAPALRGWLEGVRADTESAQLARLLFDLRAALQSARSAAEMNAVLERADALRRPARFGQLLEAYRALDQLPTGRWQAAAVAAAAVDAGAVAARSGPEPAAIGRALSAARCEAIAAALAAADPGGA
jgi:tRNA nucleotidyltransferase (CCA-adding enzyme)